MLRVGRAGERQHPQRAREAEDDLRRRRSLTPREAGAERPAFVQNRCYASTGWDRAIRAFCERRGVVYQGFSLLTANGHALKSPAVARAARRTGRTAAQVIFRFALQAGMIPLTGTKSPAHMREDLECFSFELDPAEVRAIEECGGS